MHYRYIKTGEVLRTTDQIHSSNTKKWVTLRRCYGNYWEKLGYDKGGLRKTSSMTAARRRIR